MKARPTRRDVLRASLGLGGALVLEVALPGCGPGALPRPVQPGARPYDFVPNAWIRITPKDQVIFTLDRVEMGQGTMTSHAQLVAEELEIDPARLVVELAGADRAYDNADPQLGFQITGGSTSVRASFLPLRRAGATAREMLRRAAARRWSVSLDECRAEDGAIVHAGSGRRARYGDLASAAAHESVPEVVLKPREKFKWIGRSIRRLDARQKVDGSGIYGIDVVVPGMVNAVVLRPPIVGARLASFDDKAARGMPGVVAVVQIPQGLAVVAEKYWQARRAASAVKVEWSGGERWIDSTTLRKIYTERVRREASLAKSQGNVERAEREAARVIEAVYELPYLAHATLEPQNAVAIVTDKRCEVWAPTQSPALARDVAKRATGLPYDAITVHQTLLGGGFGRRLAQDYVEEAVEIASRVRKPVKVVWSREEDTRHDGYRPLVMNLLRGAIDREGNITSFMQRIASQSIVARAVPDWAGALLPNGVPAPMKQFTGRMLGSILSGNGIVDPTSTEGAVTLPYAIPNLRFEYAQMANPVRIGSWRSVGASHNVFAVEAFLDELIRAAKKDPFEVRRNLLAKAPRDRRVLELAAEKAGWGKPLPPGRFRGIAQAKSFETCCAEVAEVSVHGSEVKVHRVVAAVDCGSVVNPDLARAQIESSIAFGLGAALKQEITFREGAVEQGNFDTFESLRMNEMPEVEVHLVPSTDSPNGVGEPGLPPIAPAVVNAILAATGRPVRTLPIRRAFAEMKKEAP